MHVLPSAVKKLIDSKYFFCKRSVRFIPIDQACDGIEDCIGGEDELTCVSGYKVNTTFPGEVKALTLSRFVSARTKANRGESKWWLLSSPTLLQCVSSQPGASCRCTAPAQVGGVCAGTAGPSNTLRRRANSWDTQSECTPTGAEEITCCLACLSWEVSNRVPSLWTVNLRVPLFLWPV